MILFKATCYKSESRASKDKFFVYVEAQDFSECEEKLNLAKYKNTDCKLIKHISNIEVVAEENKNNYIKE